MTTTTCPARRELQATLDCLQLALFDLCRSDACHHASERAALVECAAIRLRRAERAV